MPTARRSSRGSSAAQSSASGLSPQPRYAARVASMSSRRPACLLSTHHIAPERTTGPHAAAEWVTEREKLILHELFTDTSSLAMWAQLDQMSNVKRFAFREPYREL